MSISLVNRVSGRNPPKRRSPYYWWVIVLSALVTVVVSGCKPRDSEPGESVASLGSNQKSFQGGVVQEEQSGASPFQLTDVTNQWGVDFSYRNGEDQGHYAILESLGGGIAVLDFDRDGRWSASGEVSEALLEDLLTHLYFTMSGPRSSGKEAFNLQWLDRKLGAHPGLEAEDVQATLAELTAVTIGRAIRQSGIEVTEVYVCGGGAHNSNLMDRLRRQLKPATLASTAAIGMDPDWVEAVTFAWLAHRTLKGLAGNAPAVTGADGPRVLGGIFPAG